MREKYQQDIAVKDHEFQQYQYELQTLNYQLTHLAEYDRNLQFELILYRGVHQSKYVMKQPEIPATMLQAHEISRPTAVLNNEHRRLGEN
jgi:hypothetical protein